MALQLPFAKEVLCKICDNKRVWRVKLVKIGLRAPIGDIFCIKVWSRVLIFIVAVSVLTIFICLVRACFSIFPISLQSSKWNLV